MTDRQKRSSHLWTGLKYCSNHLTQISRNMQVWNDGHNSNLFLGPILNQRPGTWSGAFRAGTKIYRQNGFLGLFQGHSATLYRIFPYAAIKFMTYDQVHFVSPPSFTGCAQHQSLTFLKLVADAYHRTRDQHSTFSRWRYIWFEFNFCLWQIS